MVGAVGNPLGRWRQLAMLAAVLLAGCAQMLPRQELSMPTPWRSFDEALGQFERIVPGKTNIAELKKLGIDPYSRPNIAILNYSDLLRRFVPPGSDGLRALDSGVRECLEALQECRAFEIVLKDVRRVRSGDFFADFLNFHRVTTVSGWHFTGTVVIKGEVVMHKVWSGQPAIHEIEETKNPLGPFQGWGESNPIKF